MMSTVRRLPFGISQAELAKRPEVEQLAVSKFERRNYVSPCATSSKLSAEN